MKSFAKKIIALNLLLLNVLTMPRGVYARDTSTSTNFLAAAGAKATVAAGATAPQPSANPLLKPPVTDSLVFITSSASISPITSISASARDENPPAAKAINLRTISATVALIPIREGNETNYYNGFIGPNGEQYRNRNTFSTGMTASVGQTLEKLRGQQVSVQISQCPHSFCANNPSIVEVHSITPTAPVPVTNSVQPVPTPQSNTLTISGEDANGKFVTKIQLDDRSQPVSARRDYTNGKVVNYAQIIKQVESYRFIPGEVNLWTNSDSKLPMRIIGIPQETQTSTCYVIGGFLGRTQEEAQCSAGPSPNNIATCHLDQQCEQKLVYLSNVAHVNIKDISGIKLAAPYVSDGQDIIWVNETNTKPVPVTDPATQEGERSCYARSFDSPPTCGPMGTTSGSFAGPATPADKDPKQNAALIAYMQKYVDPNWSSSQISRQPQRLGLGGIWWAYAPSKTSPSVTTAEAAAREAAAKEAAAKAAVKAKAEIAAREAAAKEASAKAAAKAKAEIAAREAAAKGRGGAATKAAAQAKPAPRIGRG